MKLYPTAAALVCARPACLPTVQCNTVTMTLTCSYAVEHPLDTDGAEDNCHLTHGNHVFTTGTLLIDKAFLDGRLVY